MLKTIKSFSIIGISDLSSGAISIVFWLFLASFLSISSYGEIQLLISIVSIGVGFSLIANSDVIVIYEIKQKGIREFLFLLSIISTTIVSIIIFIIYLRLELAILSFMMVFGEFTTSYFMGTKSFQKYGMILISQKVLMVSLALTLNFFIGLEGIIYGIALSYIPSVAIVFRSLKRLSFNFSLLKENFGFIINNYLIKLTSTFKKHFDKIIIVSMFGLDTVGEFALGLQIFMGMMIFAQLSYKLLLIYDSEGKNTTKFNLYIIFISIIIAIIGIIVGPTAVSIFFPNFINVVDLIPILSLAVVPSVINLIFNSKFLGNEQSKFTLIGIILYSSTYLLFITLLGSEYGLYGLCLSYLLSSIIYSSYLTIMYKTQYKK